MAAAALATTHAFAFDEDNRPPCPMESFSSYLSGATNGALLMKLSGEFTRNSISTKKKKTDADSELDVFTAEKYFSGSMDGDEQLVTKPHENRPRKSSSPAPEATITSRMTSSSGTPRASGETSCGHSRDSLLPDAKKGSSGSPQKPLPPAAGKMFFSIFRCSCVSNSSKETHGQKALSCPKTGCNGEPGRMQRNAKLGTSAISSTKKENYDIAPPTPEAVGDSAVGKEPLEEERKASKRSTTDVFRSSASLGKEALASCGLGRSLTMSATFSAGAGRDSDVCSESSSDLFEIEHLALGKRAFGMGSGASATLCYEPSEASVEWSIMTASAANFSLVSDGERSPTEARMAKERPQQQQRRRPGLLGCAGDKSVRTSSNTCRLPEEMETIDRRQRNRSLDAAFPAIRYHMESPQFSDLDRRRAGHLSMARAVVPARIRHIAIFSAPARFR